MPLSRLAAVFLAGAALVPFATAHAAEAVPDFSGIWSHPSFPGFEPPASGPGPVVNTVRRPQIVDADGRPLPANNNILVSAFGTALVGDTGNPILKPNAAEIVKRHGEMSLKGSFPTPTTQCWPEPVPYILASVAVQMLQEKDRITFLYPNDHQVRRVRMNSSHPAQVTPSWYGDSIGRYEGDTLVIDTVGVKLGPFPMVDWYGTPYSPSLHVIERYRLIDYEEAKDGLERDTKENVRLLGADAGPAPVPGYRGKHLQLHFTVEDEGVFTMPWTATMTFRPGAESWREIVCAENQYELTIAGRDGAVPMANKPDF
jgi:hypothetical protein